MTIDITQSPLHEAQAESLNVIFRESPLTLSDTEFDLMLETIRSFRLEAEEKREARSARAEALQSLEIGDDLLDRLVSEVK